VSWLVSPVPSTGCVQNSAAPDRRLAGCSTGSPHTAQAGPTCRWSSASQLLVALALAASLRAFGDHLSLATLIIVITLASMIGGIASVPGGMGVVEAG